MFTSKLLVPRGRANTMRPHCSISSCIQSTCDLKRFMCVSIIDTHVYKPSPSWSSWFLSFLQVGPYRSPDNGHYLFFNGVQNPVHTWSLPAQSFVLCDSKILQIFSSPSKYFIIIFKNAFISTFSSISIAHAFTHLVYLHCCRTLFLIINTLL